MKKLRIAILVLPWIPLPPLSYAGTERVVYNLTEGLVKKGHEVTLFASGDSKTSANLEYIYEKATGLQENVMQSLKSSFYPWIHIANCFEKQKQFDIIHSHAQFLGLPFAAISSTPSVHTFHRIFEFKSQDEADLVKRYSWLNFTSISNAQRINGINYVGTVYNGVDINKYKPTSNPRRNYIFWAGRIIEKKGPREAIEIAKKLNYPLLMAGKITEKEYFEKYIKKNIDNKLITLIGDISEEKMIELYQNALLTLFTTKWNEPFGLIPVESMACNTPVVAYANGGTKETIINEKNSFLVEEKDGVNKLIEIVNRIINMNNENYDFLCKSGRQHVIDNFSIERMVDEYEKVYQRVIDRQS